MCFANSRVNGLRRWNWDGERIVHDSIVPSSRPVVMRQTGWYDIDVREFLVSKDNAIMRRTLERDIRNFIEKLEGASWELFVSRDPGSFDLRAYVITEFVSKKIEYRLTEGLDPWQFPDETLKLRSGDCEDRALLIASMLLASGISSFNVRMALGKFRAWFGKKHEDIDHVWVMYKDEAGKWQVIEPAAHVARSEKTGKKADKRGKAPHLPDSAEYIPFFIFNDVHLWTMQSHICYEGKNAIRLKQDWSKLDPSFAGWVHKTILNEALTPDVCPDWVLKSLNRHFTSVLWRRSLTVDDVDLPGGYDPRDHFDNGYIEESWKQVAVRLEQFRTAGVRNLDLFHRAAHGIGDFYAHSSYGEFAAVQNGKLALYDPNNPAASLPQAPDYGTGSDFDIASAKFSTNTALWKGSPQEAAALWKGKLISGRYAQKSDSHSIVERITFVPAVLTKDKSFKARGSLPHHNEIAVDEDQGSNVLYDSGKFAAQYNLRKDAAVRHIRQAFVDNWKP
ncbi:transglutaminase-like domain-containing protein [Nitrosovibrio tenuis]|uniref:Transglutaminase-like superfamily protein n=1 Tax=Nitrosovibrio tenuis TaxID=1233 RepID=A0A1H7KHR0_9PROT|nr:transglutaminase-like domain-containing protein [Nitrosovibrio tenuis]SEK86064.1 Transglutaminase-like superfamily protein [Nitrosovibrio tenuis]